MRLHEELRDLAEDVPRFMHPDPAAAWANARRRRVRRAAAAVGVLVAVLVVATLGLRALSRPVAIDPASGDHASGLELPRRINRPLAGVGDLPAHPGPIAGAVHRVDANGNDLGWLAVSPAGRLWRLPLGGAGTGGYPAAISPDGTRLGFLQRFPDGTTRYIVALLDHAGFRVFSGVGAAEPARTREMEEYGIGSQSPAYFSPGGRWIVVSGTRFPAAGVDDRALLLDTDDASVTVLPGPEGTSAANPAGWLDDDHLVWVDSTERAPIAVVTTLTGEVVRTVALHAPAGESADWVQWVGPVSTDPQMVDIGSASYHLSGDNAGGRVDHPRVEGARAELCPGSDAGIDPFVAVQGGGGVLVERTGGAPVVLADPGLGIDCSVWAIDALHGPRHGSISSRLWGESTGWLSWHWVEVALGLAAASMVGVLLVWVRRRRAV